MIECYRTYTRQGAFALWSLDLGERFGTSVWGEAIVMEGEFEVAPTHIELSFSHHRLWWLSNDRDRPPDPWHVSADVTQMGRCPPEYWHVGDLTAEVINLAHIADHRDHPWLDGWTRQFVAMGVLPDGRLHPELERSISPGPPRMLVIRHAELMPMWRGRGISTGLLAGALGAFEPTARFAACRIAPAALTIEYPDRVDAERATARATSSLEKIGFQQWRDVYVADLRDQALAKAARATMNGWGQSASD